MSKYYTFVGVSGGVLYHRYFENGIDKIESYSNYPYELYLKDGNGHYKSINGDKLKKVEFDKISDMAEFVKKTNRNKIFGNTSPIQQFIANEYPDEIQIDYPNYTILSFDIEVEHGRGLVFPKFHMITIKKGDTVRKTRLYKFLSQKDKDDYKVFDEKQNKWVLFEESCYKDKNIGFPKPEDVQGEILSISYEIIKGTGERKSYDMGLNDFTNKIENSEYIKCKNEKDLIEKFINVFVDLKPHFITTWNGMYFDVPYLINRARLLLGDKFVERLSPFHTYTKNVIKENKRSKNLEYDIFGIIHFDYIELYKKYGAKQESYKLDHVAKQELGVSKVHFPEYDNNLMNLYLGEYEITEEEIKYLNEKDRWCRLRTKIENEIKKRDI